jgi:hypothetical protein
MGALRIVGLCFCLAGALTILVGLFIARARIDRVSRWLPAQARVLSSQTTVESGTDSDEIFTVYEVQYSVAGASYRSRWKSWSASTAEAEQKAARHPPGSVGQIYYNPDKPQEMDGNLGRNSATFALPVGIVGGGVCGILFGLIFAVLAGSSGDLW